MERSSNSDPSSGSLPEPSATVRAGLAKRGLPARAPVVRGMVKEAAADQG